jgi:hypothetical protein
VSSTTCVNFLHPWLFFNRIWFGEGTATRPYPPYSKFCDGYETWNIGTICFQSTRTKYFHHLSIFPMLFLVIYIIISHPRDKLATHGDKNKKCWHQILFHRPMLWNCCVMSTCLTERLPAFPPVSLFSRNNNMFNSIWRCSNEKAAF